MRRRIVRTAGKAIRPNIAAEAVVFDLFDTLVDWGDAQEAASRELAAQMGIEQHLFDERWRATSHLRYTGGLHAAFTALGADHETASGLVETRRRQIRAALVPRPGVVETLQHLRSRAIKLGLVSVSDGSVPIEWSLSQFAPLFDAAVFSCDVGFQKPDSRIYRHCLEQLDVEPEAAVFVGDGGSDELAGAERVGMRAVLICRAGEEPRWESARAWKGLRISSITEILGLV